MQKYVIPTAIAVLAAFIALLVACGEGEPNNLDQAELDKIKSAMLRLQDSIAACGKNPDSPSCPNENGSSSGEDGTSSSDDGSSNPGGTSSSSGGNNDDNSSGSSNNSNASSKPPEYDKNCPESIKSKIPDFTCSWKPASVQGGDTAKLGLSISPVSDTAMTCAPNKAWRALFGCNAGVSHENCIKRDTAYFPLDKDIVTSGVYKDMKNDGKKMPSDSKEWPKVGKFDEIYGTITCTASIGSCSRTKECEPLNIEPAPAPDSNDVKLTCDWAPKEFTAAGIEGYLLSKGATLNKCEFNLGANGWGDRPLPTKAGCGRASIEYCTDSDCGSTPESIKTTNPSNITVKVVATCKGGNYTLKTLNYKVVLDPVAKGKCTWNVEKNGAGNYATTTGNGAIPSGFTLLNSYGRCTGVPPTGNTDYTLQTTDYYGNGSPWPNNGKPLTEGIYSSVKPNITCEPSVSFENCPTLEVVYAPPCKADISTYCSNNNNGKWSDVQWGTSVSKGTQAGCYFVNFTSLDNDKLEIETAPKDNGLPWKVNGTQVNSKGNVAFSTLNSKDGGFYIYLQSEAYYVHNNATLAAQGKPFCLTGARKLTCGTVPTMGMTSGRANAPSLSCNDETSPTNSSFKSNGNPFNFNTLPAAGTYSNFQATATCGGGGVLTADCSGSMTILASATDTTICGGTLVTLNAGAYNVFTNTSCGGSKFLCYGNTVEKEVTYNGSIAQTDPGAVMGDNSGWFAQWNAVKHATNKTLLTVSAGTVYCKTDW